MKHVLTCQVMCKHFPWVLVSKKLLSSIEIAWGRQYATEVWSTECPQLSLPVDFVPHV